MPSSYSTSLRFELQATGENVNTWGVRLDSAVSRVDDAVAGWTTKALVGNYSLTSANGSADEARMAMLKFTGTGTFTVTVPAVSKRYDIWNATTGVLTVTNGTASVTLIAGEVVSVMTDGAAAFKRVQPTDFGSARITSVGTPTSNTDAATKAYVDGTAFAMAAGSLPGQGGNAGKFLTTDGSAASWGSVIPTTRAISAGGLATGGGDLSADRTITVAEAASADVLTGTTKTKAMTPGDTYEALAEVTLTYGATVTPDMATFINAAVTLTGNVTLANPTSPKPGQSGRIRIIQDGTGSRLLSAVGSFWKRSGGAPTLTTTASAYDVLVYDVISTTLIVYDLIRNPA